MATLYGINNCDKVRAAKKYLQKKDIEFDFVDFKKDLDIELLDFLLTKITYEHLINLKSRTYRQLSLLEKELISKEEKMILLKNTSLLKRPILEFNNHFIVGFNINSYDESL